MGDPGAFIVIGENIHATRTIARRGVLATPAGDGVPFTDRAGQPRLMPIVPQIAARTEYGQGKVKHVLNALLLGLAGDGLAPAALAGRVEADAAASGCEYLLVGARRQQDAGAAYLDVNIDEIADDEALQIDAMTWLVRLLEPSLAVPLSLDSSSSRVLEAGCRASSGPSGPVLLNSASSERLDVLELAAEMGSPVVVIASGSERLPADAAGRLANARFMIERAASFGIPGDRLHVDLLVVPVGVAPQAGTAFLEAARLLRESNGSTVHIGGGLSNASFGLPNRRLLNEVFLALAIEAGVDSGIIDPLTTRPARARTLDRDAESFRLAVNALTGADAYALEYLTAHRSGRLVVGPALEAVQ